MVRALSDPNVPVLIASRSPAFAEGLRSFLRGLPTQVAVCHTVHQALTLIERGSPHLLIVDWNLADASGMELAMELGRRNVRIPVVFCIEPGPFRPGHEAQAAALGATGCLLVTATREAVIDAVSDAMNRAFESGPAKNMGELVARTAPRKVLLTSQERVVLRLMRQQLTYKEIAIELGVSWHTVRSHAQAVLRKLGIHSRRELDTWDSRLGAPAESGAPGQVEAAA
jgi:DNA-binding NarL/FixJ family response regulator